jgi:hypothetical protein
MHIPGRAWQRLRQPKRKGRTSTWCGTCWILTGHRRTISHQELRTKVYQATMDALATTHIDIASACRCERAQNSYHGGEATLSQLRPFLMHRWLRTHDVTISVSVRRSSSPQWYEILSRDQFGMWRAFIRRRRDEAFGNVCLHWLCPYIWHCLAFEWGLNILLTVNRTGLLHAIYEHMRIWGVFASAARVSPMESSGGDKNWDFSCDPRFLRHSAKPGAHTKRRPTEAWKNQTVWHALCFSAGNREKNISKQAHDIMP